VPFLEHIIKQYHQHSSEDQLDDNEGGLDVANSLKISICAGKEGTGCPNEVEENSE
jgi:hypothetical protein